MTRTFLLSGLMASVLALGGCDQLMPRPADTPEAEAPAPDTGSEVSEEAVPVELPVRAETAAVGAVIDWEAARRDLAARPADEGEGNFSVQSGDVAPPVPVFLPSSPVAAQSDGVSARFQPTNDGYYAYFPGDAYDIIVNGTNVVIAEPGATTVPVRTDAFNFQPSTTGAQVTFSRYGADYLVEFECKEMVDGIPACITEEDAVAFARDLAISGTR
ncbi:MAG: hypothetical protein RLO80_10010 [Hyphomonas sp.]